MFGVVQMTSNLLLESTAKSILSSMDSPNMGGPAWNYNKEKRSLKCYV